jgi:hypothetical protein
MKWNCLNNIENKWMKKYYFYERVDFGLARGLRWFGDPVGVRNIPEIMEDLSTKKKILNKLKEDLIIL